MAGEADDLLSSLLGAADPGDSGMADEGGDDTELDTGPVDDEETEQDQEQDQGDDNDEPDAGDDAGADDPDLDPLARAAAKKRGRPRKDEQQKQQQQDDDQGDNKSADPFDPSTEIRTDKAGNIYVGKELVARAGREARMFNGFRKQAVRDRKAAESMAQNTAKVANAAREVFARYQELQNQKSAFDKLDLAPEEQAIMLQVASAYKRNPVEGLKLLLTRAHMAGVDIKQLGAGGAIDPNVLMSDMKAYIAEALKPVTQQTTESANREKLAKEAAGFFQRNPRAKDVAKVLGGSHKLGQMLHEAKQRAPDMTLDELFERLDYALLRQFGGQLPTGPVGDQQQRRPKGKDQQRAERRMETNFKRSVRGKSNKLESFDDIARSVLRDAQAAADGPRGF